MSKENDESVVLDEVDEDTIPKIIPTKFVNSRVVVFNPLYASWLYVKKRFFGSPLGINKPRLEYFSKPSELSLIEAYYLLEKEEISILNIKNNKNLSKSEFFEIAKITHNKFEEKYIIYKDLRQKGYVPRPGLKFGADFVVYKKGPGLEHSPFIVHVLPHDSKITAIDMVRAGRLATSVRKKFVIANPLTCSYYFFEWFKP
ncbi:MAG: tRNA-intron lyase [Candidatus Lokiarchaeota archaeon]|nr:tRNA-intron lyase [Candidatus Lokiarchaeota archaeon]MBD3338230.1 tRNA-intron lyase [Candidatus Lokiarchaeota archaeon]